MTHLNLLFKNLPMNLKVILKFTMFLTYKWIKESDPQIYIQTIPQLIINSKYSSKNSCRQIFLIKIQTLFEFLFLNSLFTLIQQKQHLVFDHSLYILINSQTRRAWTKIRLILIFCKIVFTPQIPFVGSLYFRHWNALHKGYPNHFGPIRQNLHLGG